MNLEDIAQKAGVSRSTVSRVINGENYVSEKTRQRVLAVIDEVGYTPNPAARMLVTQRSQIISLVIPHIPGVVFEDSFYFPTLLRGITEYTNQRDYGTLVWMGDENVDAERFYRRIIRNHLMDGVILASFTRGSNFIAQLLNAKVPFVMVERAEEFSDQITYVTVDNVEAAISAVDHFIRLGRRRIATITGSLDNIDAIDRLNGYRIALGRARIPYNENLVQEGYFTREGGYRAMQALIPHKPDAVFVASDQMAVGALHALQHAGIRVPDDVGIIGFDDLPSATTTTPQLTSVHMPIQQKGMRAAELLIDLIEGITKEPRHILLPTKLVIRQSCGGSQT